MMMKEEVEEEEEVVEGGEKGKEIKIDGESTFENSNENATAVTHGVLSIGDVTAPLGNFLKAESLPGIPEHRQSPPKLHWEPTPLD